LPTSSASSASSRVCPAFSMAFSSASRTSGGGLGDPMAAHRTDRSQTVKSQNQSGALTFGERVENARKAAGLTKIALEQQAGLARGYVSRITRGEQGGKRPGAATVASLARVLRVDDAWLTTGIGRGPGEVQEGGLHAVARRPNLDRAASLLRRDGLVTPETIAHVTETTTRLGELDIATWIQLLTDIQRRQ
jgi:transcriptional regulator with XRE-family HTH domain